MRYARQGVLAGLLAMVLAVLCIPGCVEVIGQRIVWYHDAEADTLRIVLFYDGIYDNPGHRPHGSEQLPGFVADGDILLADWFGHIRWKAIQQVAQGPQPQDPMQRLAHFAGNNIDRQPLGRYEFANRQISAAQAITIREASTFIKLVNQALNEAIRVNGINVHDEHFRLTNRRIMQAARADHAWLALEGHSLVVRIPVHPRELTIAKANGLGEIAMKLLQAQPDDTKARDTLVRAIQALATTITQWEEKEDMLVIRLGHREEPTTFRFQYRPHSDYRGNLNDAVQEHVKDDLSRSLGLALLSDKKPDADSALRLLIDHGPVEERVRGLLAVANQPDSPQQKQQALRQLQILISDFSETHRLPAPPDFASIPGGDDAHIQAAYVWLGKLERFPIVE